MTAVRQFAPNQRRELLGGPVEPLLTAAGIRTRQNRSASAGGTWYNFETCPCCGHTGFQCGVLEKDSASPRQHAVKCFHPSDNPWGAEVVSYAEFLGHIGIAVPAADGDLASRGYSRATVERRMARLRSSARGLEYLHARGLTDATIGRFGLGLGEPYTDTGGVDRRDALTYPIAGADGSFSRRYGYYNVPELTLNPTDNNGWVKGEVATYFGGAIAGKTNALIVEGAKDVWRVAQALDEWAINDLAIFTSSHGTGGVPAAWKDPSFWAQYEAIYLGQDCDVAGDRLAGLAAQVITQFAAKCSHRVTPFASPVQKGSPKDWTDWLSTPRTRREFEELLEAGVPMGGLDHPEAANSSTSRTRLLPFRPVNVQSAFLGGHLYYTTQAVQVVTEKDENGRERDAEVLQTYVVRSDRTRHVAIPSPLPASAGGRGRPVTRLMPAGILIDREPSTTESSTWEWESINDWLQGKGATPPLRELLLAVEGHLRSAVWLPHDESYALLAATAAVTYVQSVFDSVPLLLVVGPAGSGKTALARGMHGLCANSIFVGQASAATVARLLDQARGFMALDDLEQIASKTGDKAQYSELCQALKLSYNQVTGIKDWTDPKTFRTQRLNFFGVKLINNTRGSDEILGSRMIRIHTMKLTPERKAVIGPLPSPPAMSTQAVRQALHRWAVEAAQEVAATYARLFAEPTSRAEEIAAPLRVIAELAGIPALTARMEHTLKRQQGRAADAEDPSAILAEVCGELAKQGYQYLSPTHVRLEMHRAIDPTWDRLHTNALPDWSRTDWIGREMRTQMIVDPYDKGLRQRVAAGGNALRAYPLTNEFRSAVFADGHQPLTVPDPWAFCTYDKKTRCGGCVYQPHCWLIPGKT